MTTIIIIAVCAWLLRPERDMLADMASGRICTPSAHSVPHN